jgi:hypothetical protein
MKLSSVDSKSGLNQYVMSYEPNSKFVNKFKDMNKSNKTTKRSGGRPIFTIPDIDLRDKVVVFWRCLDKRPVDIFRTYKLPMDDREIYKLFKDYITPANDFYETVTNHIPEYQDARKYLLKYMNKRINDDEEHAQMNRIERSYNVYMAIVNPNNGYVECTHFAIIREIFKEIVDDETENRAKSAIELWWKNGQKMKHNQTEYSTIYWW